LSFITAPAFGSFDPDIGGQYSFALLASDAQGVEIGRSAINVQVVSAPGSLALLALGLAGVRAARRRRRA